MATELAELRAACNRIEHAAQWYADGIATKTMLDAVLKDAQLLVRAYMPANREGDELPVTYGECLDHFEAIMSNAGKIVVTLPAPRVIVRTKRQLRQLLAGLGISTDATP